jgi:hypothetical protein
MPRRPKHDPTPVEDVHVIEDLTPASETEPAADDDRMRAVTPRLALSVPGAIGGALLVCALALGASFGSDRAPNIDEHDAGGRAATVAEAGDDSAKLGDEHATGDEAKDGDAAEQADEPKGGDEAKDGDTADQPAEAPDKPEADEPKPEKPKTEKPKTEKPKAEQPKPEAPKPAMTLALSKQEGAILIDWSACGVDGADYYKVVRSKDSTVRWPAGDNDELVAAVEIGGKTKAWDEHAPSGKKVWYRVFCVRHTEDGYKVLAASPAKAITAPDKPKPDPIPEPAAMWINADVDGGAVVLHWEACGSDAFSHYRILRKTDGEPKVIAEVENYEVTTYVDHAVEPGVTYRYLVQAKGHQGDTWFLLGTTEWVAVSVE